MPFASARHWSSVLSVYAVVFIFCCLRGVSPRSLEGELDADVEEPLNRPSRIVNGEDAKFGEITYQVSVQYMGYPFCGGTYIRKGWVATAAHCVYKKKASNLKVALGALDIDDASIPVLRVKKIYAHEYNDDIKKDDIALLELEPNHHMDKNRLSDHPFQPIEMAPENFDPSDEVCLISGWGHVKSHDSFVPKRLKKAPVLVLSRQGCADMFKTTPYPYDRVDNTMICAGSHKIDACQGDSGGPLVCENKKGEKFLSGIVSWGVGCATPGLAGVYTNVSKYKKWAEDIMNGKADGK